jgi:hypothetical protein
MIRLDDATAREPSKREWPQKAQKNTKSRSTLTPGSQKRASQKIPHSLSFLCLFVLFVAIPAHAVEERCCSL